MAVWHEPNQIEVRNELDRICAELNENVADDPDFSEVVGIDMATMLAHAGNVMSSYLESEKVDPITLLDPGHWIRLYTMGFVVGTKYGRTHPLEGA